jgi:hypothetical protein
MLIKFHPVASLLPSKHSEGTGKNKASEGPKSTSTFHSCDHQQKNAFSQKAELRSV